MNDLDLDLATARRVGVGAYRAECPTTHEEYIAMLGQRVTINGRPAVWLLCACCDGLLHTGDDMDPREPQWHLYFDDTPARQQVA